MIWLIPRIDKIVVPVDLVLTPSIEDAVKNPEENESPPSELQCRSKRNQPQAGKADSLV
jgi:hypothetical protein